MPTLRGNITAHGEPAVSAVVELHNSQGDVLDQVQVDAHGAYIYHLVAGHWKLNVWDAHGHRGTADVTIEEGDEDTVVDVALDESEGNQ
jgi:hypothetical protein